MDETPKLFDIRREEIDGIPVFWAESPLGFVAGLVFRVGRVDEELANSGITHLVEHLALPASETDTAFNGMVEGATTTFWADGEQAGVLDLLASVARSLADPPLDRFEHERRILLTEAASSGRGVIPHTASFRFGPLGFGLIGYDELGLHRITRDDVTAWVRAKFTTDNVAVYMTGRPPDHLELALPRGSRPPIPSPQPIAYLTFPCAFPHGVPERVAVSMVGNRSEGLLMALSIGARRVKERLRARAGITYEVDWSYEPLTLDLAHVVFWADCLDENVEIVRNGILTTLADLAERGPTPEELARDADETRRRLLDPGWLVTSLYHRAAWELMGGEFETEAERLRGRRDVTPSDAAAALAPALETMLLTVPEGGRVPGGRFGLYPGSSPAVVTGRRYRRPRPLLRRRDPETLVVGDDGVMREDGESRRTTRFDECLAVLSWNDGTRGLFSRDGFYVEVDPAGWRGAAELTGFIDERATAPRIPMDETQDFVDPDLEAGAAAARRGDHVEAVERLTAGLEREPANWEAWCWLGFSQLKLRHPLAALTSADRAVALAGDREWPHRIRANALTDLHRVDEAADSAQRALELEPSELFALEDVCLMLTEVGRDRAARAAADRAIELFPEEAVAWNASGVVLGAFGSRSAAEDAFRKAIELEPAFSMWWNNLGWVQLLEGRHAEALKSFDQALALDDSNRLAAQNRAVVLGWLGREREAERVRGKLLEANLAHAEQLVTRNPEDAEAHLELGRCLTRLGRFDDALEEARVAVRLGSDSPHVLIKAAAVEARRGNCERAGRLLAQAASIGPESMEALCTRSEIAAICERAEEAAEAAERALELNDNDSRAWLAKVQASLAAGDFESALDWSARVLERAPLDCCAHAWRGLAERERGDVEAARASLRNAAVINPTCAAKRRLGAALG